MTLLDHRIRYYEGLGLEARAAIACELLERPELRHELERLERTAERFASRPPIADDARSPRGILPAGDIARREDQGQ